MKSRKVSLGIFIATMPLLLGAAEISTEGMTFHIGANYRNFDDVEFQGFAFDNFNNSAVVGGPFGVQGFVNVGSNPPPQIQADYVMFGGSEDDTDGWGPGFGIELPVGNEEEDIALSLVGNFGFFSLQAGEISSDGLLTGSAPHDVLGDGTVVPINPNTTPDPTQNLTPGAPTGVQVENDFDMELYVLDIGLKGTIGVMDNFAFAVAAGPTLSIGDLDTFQREVGSAGGRRTSDSETDVVLGLYVNLEASYQFNESLGVSLGYRYDYASDDVSTDQAELDLDGHGGQIRVNIAF